MMIKRQHDIVHFVENKSKKLQTLESGYFISPSLIMMEHNFN